MKKTKGQRPTGTKSKTKQSKKAKAKQSKTKQNKTKHSKTMSNNNSNNTCQEFADAFVVACRTGNLEMAQFFLLSAKSSIGPDVFQTACAAACEHGHLPVLQELEQSASVLETHATSLAATANASAVSAAASAVSAAASAFSAAAADSTSTASDIVSAATAVESAVESAAVAVGVALTYTTKPKYTIDWNHLYQVACQNNHTNVAEWIVSIYPNAGFSDPNPNKAFITACANGNLDLASRCFSKYAGNIPKAIYQHAFVVACVNGHVEVVKWMVPLINNLFASGLFCKACNKGDVNTTIKDWAVNSFYDTCCKGHLEIAKILVDECGVTSNSFKHRNTLNKCFMNACKYGHLDVAKWLLSTFPAPAIDISYGECETHHDLFIQTAFSWACKNGHMEIVQWFHEMDPAKYAFTVTQKTVITACQAPAPASASASASSETTNK